MSASWKRPDNVPYPNIWSKFDGKKKINGRVPKFWIQDIPEDQAEEAANFMGQNFVYEEPLCKYLNLTEDKLSMEEGRQAWKKIVADKLALACYMENPEPNGKPIMAGVNITCIKAKDDSDFKFSGEKLQIMVEIVMYLSAQVDTFKIANDDKYLSAVGMSVLPDFRGQGIGEQLLKAREPLCKAMGLKCTFTCFSSSISQKLAQKVGFKDAFSISFEKLEEINPRFRFSGITENNKILRLMYKIFD